MRRADLIAKLETTRRLQQAVLTTEQLRNSAPSAAAAAASVHKGTKDQSGSGQSQSLSRAAAALAAAQKARMDGRPHHINRYGEKLMYGMCSTHTGLFLPCRKNRLAARSGSALVKFGAGVAHYFRFVGTMGLLLLVLLLTELPAMALFANIPGSIYQKVAAEGVASGVLPVNSTIASLSQMLDVAERSRIGSGPTLANVIAAVSPGNLGGLPANATIFTGAFGSQGLPVSVAVLLLSCWQAAVSLWGLTCALRIIEEESADARQLAAEVLTPANFSIMLPHVPSRAEADGLARKVEAATGTRVEEVNIAYDYGSLLKLAWRQRRTMDRLQVVDEKLFSIYKEQIIKKQRRQQQQWRRSSGAARVAPAPGAATAATGEGEDPSEADMEAAAGQNPEMTALRKRRVALLLDHEATQAHMRDGRITSGAVTAFVTLKTRHEALKALDQLRKEWSCNPLATGPGKRLVAEVAPEPSLVLWHNLAASWVERQCRQMVSFVLSLALLGVSFATVSVSLQLRTGSDLPGWAMVVVPLVASFINYCLKATMGVLASFERHHDRGTMEQSLFYRLAVRVLTNELLLLFLDRLGTGPFVRSLFALPGSLADGKLIHAAPSFYLSTGTLLLLNVGTGCMLALVPSILRTCWQSVHMGCYRGGCLRIRSQRQLTRTFAGLQLDFTGRYAHAAVLAMGCITLSPALPFITVVGFIGCVLIYWWDKYYFTHRMATPPNYDMSIGQMATRWLPFAFALRIVVALWVLSAPHVPTGHTLRRANSLGDAQGIQGAEPTADSATLLSDVCLPQLIAVVLAVLTTLFLGAGWFLEWLCTCGRLRPSRNLDVATLFRGEKALRYTPRRRARALKTVDTPRATFQPVGAELTYMDAVEDGLICGISSYNIVENPMYADAFVAATYGGRKVIPNRASLKRMEEAPVSTPLAAAGVPSAAAQLAARTAPRSRAEEEMQRNAEDALGASDQPLPPEPRGQQRRWRRGRGNRVGQLKPVKIS